MGTRVMQASRHHVMRASRDVVNYAKQCSSLVSLSRSPSPHHPPLRPRHHVSIPGQHILHVFVIVVTYISRNCYMHLSNCYMYITPSTPIEAWLPCLNPRAALPSRNCRAFTLFLAFDPLKTTREPLLIIRLPPYPHRDTFCVVIQHHMGILVMTY